MSYTLHMATLRAHVRMSEGGRIVIPAAFRKALDVSPGDELILELVDGGVRIRTRTEGIRRAQAIAARYKTDVSAVDELIAERRAEAARE